MNPQSTSTSVPLSAFKWDKVARTLQCDTSVFNPRGKPFSVVSERTGKSITFVPDTDDMMAHECYDGEVSSWKPVEACSVVRLFVSNWG